MTIRWLGMYGLFHRDSLRWELTQKQREVSAEWTIKGRPFTFGQRTVRIGLLVKSKAVVRRIRKDAYTEWPDGSVAVYWRVGNKSLNKSMMDTHLWEAICYPSYVAIVLTANCDSYYKQLACDAVTEFRMPLLMLQADNKTLKPLSGEKGSVSQVISSQ